MVVARIIRLTVGIAWMFRSDVDTRLEVLASDGLVSNWIVPRPALSNSRLQLRYRIDYP